MRRKRRNISKIRENPPSVLRGSFVDVTENGRIANMQDDVDTVYDNTSMSRYNPSAVSSVEDDYSHLRPSQVLFVDPAYSHIRNHQQGACVILEADYSCLGRNETKTKQTHNEQSTIASDYDNVQFNQLCSMQSVRNCTDDVYDKLHYK